MKQSKLPNQQLFPAIRNFSLNPHPRRRASLTSVPAVELCRVDAKASREDLARHPDDKRCGLDASRFNHDTPMTVLNWQSRRQFAFGERPREVSS